MHRHFVNRPYIPEDSGNLFTETANVGLGLLAPVNPAINPRQTKPHEVIFEVTPHISAWVRGMLKLEEAQNELEAAVEYYAGKALSRNYIDIFKQERAHEEIKRLKAGISGLEGEQRDYIRGISTALRRWDQEKEFMAFVLEKTWDFLSETLEYTGETLPSLFFNALIRDLNCQTTR
ncbi:hypothetical protein F5Y12DRAFT_99523 [Xylaria sp. FL1777]|nr:hypothetical protein F5Y12DRAFT_99523 [Xylaria sp. FL1777]